MCWRELSIRWGTRQVPQDHEEISVLRQKNTIDSLDSNESTQAFVSQGGNEGRREAGITGVFRLRIQNCEIKISVSSKQLYPLN